MTERTNHCFSIQFKANNSLVQFFLVSNGSAKLTFTRSSCNWLLLSPSKTIPEFLNNHHSHPNGFYWRVTNTHGSSPQPTASRPPTCSLTTATGSNQVLRNRLLVQCNIFSLFRQSFSWLLLLSLTIKILPLTSFGIKLNHFCSYSVPRML